MFFIGCFLTFLLRFKTLLFPVFFFSIAGLHNNNKEKGEVEAPEKIRPKAGRRYNLTCFLVASFSAQCLAFSKMRVYMLVFACSFFFFLSSEHQRANSTSPFAGCRGSSKSFFLMKSYTKSFPLSRSLFLFISFFFFLVAGITDLSPLYLSAGFFFFLLGVAHAWCWNNN